MKVFISYAREDIETAKKLYHDLKQAGVSPWMDKEDLLPGQNWRMLIPKAIQESKYFLAVLSSHSLTKKGFVQRELKMALDILEEFPAAAEDIFIIPIRIEDCKPEDEKLKYLHWADFFPSYEEGLNQILRVLAPDYRAGTSAQPKNVSEEPVEVVPIMFQLRKKPITVSDEEASKIFKLKQDSDAWLRPLEYVKNDFRDNGDTITDRATGLTWQKSGSPNYMNYENAKAYIQELNSKKFAGFNDWRLPTVDELKSLLTQEKQSNNLYINPIFDENQSWCWTSDIRASGGAWHVNFNFGYISWYNVSYNYARAVRSGQ